MITKQRFTMEMYQPFDENDKLQTIFIKLTHEKALNLPRIDQFRIISWQFQQFWKHQNNQGLFNIPSFYIPRLMIRNKFLVFLWRASGPGFSFLITELFCSSVCVLREAACIFNVQFYFIWKYIFFLFTSQLIRHVSPEKIFSVDQNNCSIRHIIFSYRSINNLSRI